MSNSEKTESNSSSRKDQKHLDQKQCQQCQVPSAEQLTQLPGDNTSGDQGSIVSQDFITPEVGLTVISAAIKHYRDSKPA